MFQVPFLKCHPVGPWRHIFSMAIPALFKSLPHEIWTNTPPLFLAWDAVALWWEMLTSFARFVGLFFCYGMLL